jgi:putative phage-type endonuclease
MTQEHAKYTPEVVADTKGMPEEEWLELRRRGIGGSDAAAVIGLSPFKTARDAYYDKLNIAPAEPDDGNWVAMEVGHLLEDLVIRIFRKKTGYKVGKLTAMLRHPKHPFMLADVDGLVELPDKSGAVLEIKTTNYHAKDNWFSDGGEEIVPLHYELQCRHYMAVLDVDRAYVCCLYGNNENETLIRRIDRDRELESELIALEQDFWENRVQARIPPQYTEDGDLVLESVRRRFGKADASAPEITLSGEVSKLAARYLELQAEKSKSDVGAKKLDEELKQLKGLIAVEMGVNTLGAVTVNGTEYAVAYKPVQRSGIDKDGLLRLKERQPAIYKEYVRTAESRRFTISVKTKERGGGDGV